MSHAWNHRILHQWPLHSSPIAASPRRSRHSDQAELLPLFTGAKHVCFLEELAKMVMCHSLPSDGTLPQTNDLRKRWRCILKLLEARVNAF